MSAREFAQRVLGVAAGAVAGVLAAWLWLSGWGDPGLAVFGGCCSGLLMRWSVMQWPPPRRKADSAPLHRRQSAEHGTSGGITRPIFVSAGHGGAR